MAIGRETVRIYPDEQGPKLPRFPIVRLVLVALVLAYPFYWWFVKRVEVGPNELLVLINKTGRSLPGEHADQVVLYPDLIKSLAAQDGVAEERVAGRYKGIRFDVLTEGRHFYSPIWYERQIVPATLVPEGKFGVLIRNFGRPLPPGQTVAVRADERGPVSGTLPPGRHNINPYCFDVQLFDKIVVPEGWIGVQSVLSGREPKLANEYVVQPGERGVQPDTLGPGTYLDRNPYEVRVDLVDMRSQKYDMLAEDAIEFPSNDGFTIHMEATVEWAVYPDRAPWVVVEVGDLDDVVTKVIRPYATSLARIQGSKMTAREFMGAREAFQRRLFNDLRERCHEQGILIKTAIVRDLKPPERVRAIIRERELADQTLTKYENEIAEAQARAKLVEQEELANQQSAMGDANKQVVSVTVQAEQGRAVSVTAANQRLDVAKLDLEAARKKAEAILARGKAEAAVVLMNFRAQAEPLQAMVRAFGDGETFARNQFFQKVAPAIRSVLANTDGPFAEVFKSFEMPSGGARGGAPPGDASPPRKRESVGSAAGSSKDRDAAKGGR